MTVTEEGGFAVLNWTASVGPNLDKYKIYRKSTSGEDPVTLSYRMTINAFNGGNPVTTWTDINPLVGSGQLRLYYAIAAVDISGSESILSNYDWVLWDGDFQKKGTKQNIVTYEYKLYNNYPNPFNPSTQISYSLAEDADVTLKVYDMLGIEVLVLLNVTQPAGNYKINFNGENLASGIYVYRVVAGKNGRVLFTDTKQMILIK